MTKWFESGETEQTPIISCRIRLARNLENYPFPTLLSDEDAGKMMDETVKVIKDNEKNFDFLKMQNCPKQDKLVMLEQHILSNALYKSEKNAGLVKHADDSLSVMLNEEDHIRIQSIMPADEIDKAYQAADRLDNTIEASVSYAFHKDFGYLTACPTNTGTGLRASFMLHLPMLEKTGHLKSVIPALGKFGMTVRGLYGEGTEPLGSIYQISNQMTLGKSEAHIIEALKTVTKQVIDSENWLLQKTLEQDKYTIADSVYRSLGVLERCRKISSKEAMTLLSNVRLGYMAGIIDEKRPKYTVHHMMMNIQPGSLSKRAGEPLDEKSRDVFRAEYLRSCFTQPKRQPKKTEDKSEES